MADSENRNNLPLKPGDKQFNMEARLMLAFVLMGAILFLSQYLYKPTVPPKAVKSAQQSSQAETKPAIAPAAAVAPATTPVPAPAGSTTPVADSSERAFNIDTNLYHIVFSNNGAVVQSWQLKQYKDENGKPVDVVNQAAAGKLDYPFSLAFKGTKPSVDLNHVLFQAKPSEDHLGIEFDYSNGRTITHKSFRFQKDSYLSEVATSVTESGTPLPHLIAWRGGFGDPTVTNPVAAQHSLYYDLSNGKLVVKDAKAAKDGPITAAGNFSFAGVEDTFFAAVFLPRDGRTLEITTVSDPLPTTSDPNKTENRVGAEVGGDGQNQYSLYAGPKDLDLLKKVNPKLTNIVDFGWFSILAKPLFLAVNWVNDAWVHNYGWSIVVVTLIINMVLLPLRFTTMRSMKKMQSLQPQIAAINEKYKNIGLRDPRKQEQNQEVMALYQKHGVNPLGGCLPMIPQFLILIAFYRVLSVSIEMRGAHWFWIHDLSQPEKLAIHILPILMVITQIVLQKMTPNTTTDPTQQRMMLLMPLMMLFFFYSAQSGLVLYWLTGNVVGLIQQWFFNRAFHVGSAPASATVIDTKVKKPRK